MQAVSTQVPDWHTEPTSQSTEPHWRERHLPPKHDESVGHTTPTQSRSAQALLTQTCAAEQSVAEQVRG